MTKVTYRRKFILAYGPDATVTAVSVMAEEQAEAHTRICEQEA